MIAKKLVRLDAFVKGHATDKCPTGEAAACRELKRRGVNLPRLTLWRWLDKHFKPSGAWVYVMGQVGVDVDYLR